MKPTIAIAIALLLAGCGTPDEKLNSSPNNANNVSNNPNNGPNNSPNNDGGIDPTNYDQSCNNDSNCALVNSGDPCGCHVCPDGSIAQSSLETYQNDIAAAMCGEVSCPALGCAEDLLPHCNAGTCEVRTAKYVQAEQFDQTCSEDADCVAVFEGEVCAECQYCHNAAINVANQEAYQSEFDVECTSGSDCGCQAVEAFCNEGRCELSQG